MRKILALVAMLGSLAACTPGGMSSLSLPGGAPSGPSYVVTAEFGDVLDLVPQAAVKVNDVTVGSVERIRLGSGWTAEVTLRISRSVHLPANATAAIRQTSLLGEKFVELASPVGDSPHGELADGDVIPLSRTTRSAQVEELLGALGLVLSGGGLDQLRVINSQLSAALDGNEAQAKDALQQLTDFVGGLEAQKADIAAAIDALDRLTARLAAQTDTIGAAVDSLAPGLTVLADERAQLTGALTALGKLGVVGTHVIESSRDDTLADIASLKPILDQLVKAGDALPKAVDFLLTFPFPPNATSGVKDGQMNLWATIDADASKILANLLAAAPPARPGQPSVPNLPIPTVPVPVPVPTVTLPVPVPTVTLPVPVPTVTLPVPVPTVTLPVPSLTLPPLALGQSSALTGRPIARGAAPLGAADGVQGPLLTVLNGGLSA
jgi:phospholipid/cholesterol/gamma-HCH transport system substrate-binding protein